MDTKITIVVHSGGFHADDVFAAATLLKALEGKPVEVRVVRSRDRKVIESADFVADVGGVYDADKNRFDHHQTGGAGSRENGIPYAAFGLVWKKFGTGISGSSEIARIVDEALVQPVDYGDSFGLPLQEITADSGIYPYTLDRLISVFGSTFEETDRDGDSVFFRLVVIAREILEREIERARAFESARPLVLKAYRESGDKRIVVLPGDYPWFHVLIEHPEPLFAVFPDDGSGNWGVSAVRRGWHDFRNRKDFPVGWAGKRNDELVQVSGVEDAIFCHNRLFFAIAKSKEGALALAQKALEG